MLFNSKLLQTSSWPGSLIRGKSRLRKIKKKRIYDAIFTNKFGWEQEWGTAHELFDRLTERGREGGNSA